mgnify:CR=1 FL=1
MIVSQKLESGVRLKEQHVAKELGISATPIREAFKKLAADGFVEIKPYYGVVVRRWTFLKQVYLGAITSM